MAYTGDRDQFCACGDSLQRRDQLIGRAKTVACAAHEECRGSQVREVRGAQFERSFWWMKWIGQQQESIDQPRLIRCQHGRLPSSVRMTTEKHPARNLPPQRRDRCGQPLLIALSAAAGRRSAVPHLAEGQIAAKNRKT